MSKINAELEDYLSKRKKAEPKLEKKEEKIVEKDKMAEKDKEMEDAVDEKENVEEYEQKSEGKKGKSLFQKIKDWLVGEDEEESEEIEEKKETPQVNEELKEVIKIQNKWIMKLPMKTIKEFKESEDYKRYKEILEKYNLIKPKN